MSESVPGLKTVRPHRGQTWVSREGRVRMVIDVSDTHAMLGGRVKNTWVRWRKHPDGSATLDRHWLAELSPEEAHCYGVSAHPNVQEPDQ